MSSYGDRIFDNALALGRSNVVTIEMARRHCSHMNFTEFGGSGMAEELSGLPINSRRVHCPYANGGVSPNLDIIAGEFYEEHCIDCAYRQPTGEVPNLATVVGARHEEATIAAEIKHQATARLHGEWIQRVELRRAIIASGDPAMSQALGDIGIMDTEPGAVADSDARSGALRRLTALADRKPDVISVPVVDHVLHLVNRVGIAALLGPLRHLARGREELARSILSAATLTLRRAADIEAGRCVIDLRNHLSASDIDKEVVRSLIHLAGAPMIDFLGRSRSNTANDPGSLQTAAAVAPDMVVAVIREMLPSPQRSSRLILLPGLKPHEERESTAEYNRGSAAEAIRVLTYTEPEIAASLADALVLNLGVDGNNDYDHQPIGNVKRALATMILLEVGDVSTKLEVAGRNSSEELRMRLFEVYERAAHILDPGDRWRESGDPQLTDERRHACHGYLISIGLTRVEGDWGHNVASSAARIVEDLAKMEPRWAFDRLDAILGAFLRAVGEIDHPAQPIIGVVEKLSPSLSELAEFGRRHSFHATSRELLSAVEQIAGIDIVVVCGAITQLINNEREADLGVEVVSRLLSLLGRIGKRHGDRTGVLRAILPTLHQYLVDSEVVLRAAALDAWIEIESTHKLPSTVADLLPALLLDQFYLVIRSVLRAASQLNWTDEDRVLLLRYAIYFCENVDAGKHLDTLKAAMSAVGTMIHDIEDFRIPGEILLLRRTADLDVYDQRHSLRYGWHPEIAHSADMAALRLQQARDPRINDRYNSRDDEELCALLDCGAGLLALPTEDLISAALDLAPDFPIGSAEFAEVAWRAGRLGDAAEIMRAVVDATPAVPAYTDYRSLAQILLHTVELDIAAAAGEDLVPEIDVLTEGTDAIVEGRSELPFHLLAQLRARVVIRCLLRDDKPPAAYGHPDMNNASQRRGRGNAIRDRAAQLASAATELDDASQKATVTGIYVRTFAGLCQVGADLLYMDAAELDADTVAFDAHMVAAQRRTRDLEIELSKHFAVDDPLTSPLASALAAIKDIKNGDAVAPALANWSTLPLPILIVEGPRRVRHNLHLDATTENRIVDEPDVAVVFASIDGNLITGPQVLRPNFVYDLQLEVWPGAWPAWASSLDAELISHLSQNEVQTPIFVWPRPADFDNAAPLIGNGTLVLRFGLGAGQPAPPFLVSLRWRGTQDGEELTETVDVAGHSQLRFRPFDASRDYITSFPIFDERLLAQYDKLHQAGYDENQIQAFCRLFTGVCRVGLTMTWDKKYKRGANVSERDFHDDLFGRLLGEPELGGRLERGTALALGFLDVRHDGITAELKVERRTPVSKETAPKYMGQPTQYAAADGARLSILCVLDMSAKESPIGTPENYMFMLQPALHGLNNPEAPSLVAVIVINGNLPSPSSWSRRKADVQS